MRRLLPEGLAVDTSGGRAWVSLTSFVMAGTGCGSFPSRGPARCCRPPAPSGRRTTSGGRTCRAAVTA
ncbi:DUF2071 domain-containing protein [Streptomyces sp. NWU49]|uniref:DUF2071 domain-containing protein n=1 Tax=Streptomyces sp. NWU49 TaxID=2201153 RepID=UPI00215AE754|nr:DUF2071 domain-containing protein [Streptomyces sp. NWU49]